MAVCVCTVPQDSSSLERAHLFARTRPSKSENAKANARNTSLVLAAKSDSTPKGVASSPLSDQLASHRCSSELQAHGKSPSLLGNVREDETHITQPWTERQLMQYLIGDTHTHTARAKKSKRVCVLRASQPASQQQQQQHYPIAAVSPPKKQPLSALCRTGRLVVVVGGRGGKEEEEERTEQSRLRAGARVSEPLVQGAAAWERRTHTHTRLFIVG